MPGLADSLGTLLAQVRRVADAVTPARLAGSYGRLAVPPGQARDIPEVIARMRAIDAALPADDGVAAFHRMYLLVTERVDARVRAGDFANPAFAQRLDVVFAGLYLDAFAAGEGAGAAWRPLFRARRDSRVRPIQFALAGMNAHINHDLAVATVAACRQLGLTLRSRGVHADYLRVNGLLTDTVEEVRQSFLNPLGRQADEEVAPLLNLVGGFSIARARDAAWLGAEAQWVLRRHARLYDEWVASHAATVGLATRQLLLPLLVGGRP